MACDADTIVFCSCDLISLVIQAVGGASASEAAENHKDASQVCALLMIRAHIMTAISGW